MYVEIWLSVPVNMVYSFNAFIIIIGGLWEVRKLVEGLGFTDHLLSCARMFTSPLLFQDGSTAPSSKSWTVWCYLLSAWLPLSATTSLLLLAFFSLCSFCLSPFHFSIFLRLPTKRLAFRTIACRWDCIWGQASLPSQITGDVTSRSLAFLSYFHPWSFCWQVLHLTEGLLPTPPRIVFLSDINLGPRVRGNLRLPCTLK